MVSPDLILQELLQEDAHAADAALRHFQSCVRTTLLLSNGYECQEKVEASVSGFVGSFTTDPNHVPLSD